MDNAIQPAGSILEEVRQNLFDNEEDMPRDFMVSFSLAFLAEFSELMHINLPPPTG